VFALGQPAVGTAAIAATAKVLALYTLSLPGARMLFNRSLRSKLSLNLLADVCALAPAQSSVTSLPKTHHQTSQRLHSPHTTIPHLVITIAHPRPRRPRAFLFASRAAQVCAVGSTPHHHHPRARPREQRLGPIYVTAPDFSLMQLHIPMGSS
jgi:hypothetical protein